MRRSFAVPALFLALALVSVAPARASHVACGDTITTDTTLDGDLTCPGDGLVVGADDVALDLGGHTISGADVGTGVFTEYNRTTVRRGSIRGFETGIFLGEGANSVVRRLLITNNVTGMLVSRVGANNATDGLLVRQNTLSGNAGAGLFSLDSYNLHIERNRVVGNGGIGLGLGGEVFRSVVEGNVASGNGGDGIEVADGPLIGDTPELANEVTRNTANFNADLGIEAPVATIALVIDGGGNRASGNGNPLQCVGITCR
jgi:hypothetical protein